MMLAMDEMSGCVVSGPNLTAVNNEALERLSDALSIDGGKEWDGISDGT